MRKLVPASGFMLVFFLLLFPINVAALTFSLDFFYDGVRRPAGSSPWQTAIFEDVSTDRVKLTLQSTNLISSENVGSLFFNFDQTISGIISRQVSGPLSQILIGQNSQTAGDSSGFDIQFSFTQQFGTGQSAVYTLLGQGLSASSFDFVNQGGDFFSAAQVLGIGANSTFAWIADSKTNGPGPGPIPEPASLLLLTVGLAGIGFFGRKRLVI